MSNPPRICILDFNFVLVSKDSTIISESSLVDFNRSKLQTFHISCNEKTQAQARQKYGSDSQQLIVNSLLFESGCLKFSHFCLILRYELAKFDVVLVKGDQKLNLVRAIVKDAGLNNQLHEMGHFGCPNTTELVNKSFDDN